MGEKNGRFNAELLGAYMDRAGISGYRLAAELGAKKGTVYNWLRGGMPGPAYLKKIGEYFQVDPVIFLADGFDVMHSRLMQLIYKIFEKERDGRYKVKVSLSGLVSALDKLGVFDEPPEKELDLPESALMQLLPQLEEKAIKRAEAHVMALADANFLKSLVAEHKDKIEALLAEDGD